MTSDTVSTKATRRAAKRAARADKTRRKALSPLRIILQLACVPLAAFAIAMSVYVRTSDYPPNDAVRHLFALAGCDAAAAVGLAPAAAGGIGYHPRNDPDGDGVACNAPEHSRSVAIDPNAESLGDGGTAGRMSSGAKFLRP